MKTPSPYAHIFTALAEDKNVQLQIMLDIWVGCATYQVLRRIADETLGPDEVRVKPETIRIGSREVPKPRTDGGGYTLDIRHRFFLWDKEEDRDAAADAICALLEGRE